MSKSQVGEGQDRIAEIRVVKDIEYLAAKLEVKPLGDLGVLGDGEVGIQESRASDGVAPEASGMTAAGNSRVVVGASSCRGAAGSAGKCEGCARS